MAPLGMVLLVQHVTGSYAVAGVVTGSFAFGTAAGAPWWGRALDRWGQSLVIVPTSVLSSSFLVLLALVCASHVPGTGVWLILALAALSGLAFPPMTPAMRAAWRVVLPESSYRAAYALDAVAQETIFIMGPLLLSVLLVTGPPAMPLIITAALMLLGGLGYSVTSAARGAAHRGRRRKGGDRTEPRGDQGPEGSGPQLRRRQVSLLPRAFIPPLVISLGMAVAFGSIDTSLAATARDLLADQGQLGILFAAIAGGSALGGLWFGTRDVGHLAQIRLLPLLLAGFAMGLAPLSVLVGEAVPTLVMLLPLLFLAGMCIAPTTIILQNLVDAVAPPGRINEGQAWLSTSITTGAGAGTAVAGVVVDLAGVPWSFAVASSAALLASAVAFVLSRRVRRRGHSRPERRDVIPDRRPASS